MSHHALLGAVSRPPAAASAWAPTDSPLVIEYGDTTTLRTAANAVPTTGQTVETWLSNGSVGTLTMTRVAGAPTLQLSNGRPYLAIPDAGADARIFGFAPKDLVGTELWALMRKPAGVRMIFCRAGANAQVKMGLNFVLTGSPPIYGNALPIATGVPADTWVIARGQFRPDGAFVEVDGADRSSVVAAQASFVVDSIGNYPAGQACDYDIAAYVTVYGTADAALEADLYAYLGAERDLLNGV